MVQGGSHLGQKPFLVGPEGPLQDQPVGRMVAAEDGPAQFQAREETLHLPEQAGLVQGLPAWEPGAEAPVAAGEGDDQRRKVFRLGFVHQPRGVVRMRHP